MKGHFMTRTIILAAFAFALTAVPAWGSARACGGYGNIDPVAQQMEGVVRTHFASHRRQVQLVDVARLGVVAQRSRRTPAEHLVRVRFSRGEELFVQVLRLSNESGSWRVVGGERPLRA